MLLNHLLEIHMGELWNMYKSCGAHTIFIRFTVSTTERGSLHQLLHFSRCLSSGGPKFNQRSAGSGDTITPKCLKLLAMAILLTTSGRGAANGSRGIRIDLDQLMVKLENPPNSMIIPSMFAMRH